MKRAHVLFTSGQQVQFDCESLTVITNGFGNFTRIEWTNSETGPLFIRLENVDAVWSIDITDEPGA